MRNGKDAPTFNALLSIEIVFLLSSQQFNNSWHKISIFNINTHIHTHLSLLFCFLLFDSKTKRQGFQGLLSYTVNCLACLVLCENFWEGHLPKAPLDDDIQWMCNDLVSQLNWTVITGKRTFFYRVLKNWGIIEGLKTVNWLPNHQNGKLTIRYRSVCMTIISTRTRTKWPSLYHWIDPWKGISIYPLLSAVPSIRNTI